MMNNELGHAIYQDKWRELVDKTMADYSSLSSDERLWFNIRALIDAVNNGGLISHYYNSGADHNKDTIDDLMRLQFADVAKMLMEINKLFPNGSPSTMIEERNAVISGWSDEEPERETLFDELDEKFYRRTQQLERDLDEFVRQNILTS
jgi:hypothetical protein